MKTFEVPIHYRSSLIGAIKEIRRKADKLKKDFTPTIINLDNRLEIILARHFGFCYGVENAIEIAFTTIDNNPDKRIFLLSEMIHNPQVNADLVKRGVQFIMDTKGVQQIPWDELNSDDIVIIPAFGTTLEIEKTLRNKGIEPSKFNTTCPFVERVWNRSEKIGKDGYTIVVHGKPKHEETRATFSHSKANTATVVIKDMNEASRLATYINGTSPAEQFYTEFSGQYSEGFDVTTDLQKIGVVNQTTMLASDTQGIADYLKQVMIERYQLKENEIRMHFADTRDTLCYATNDNQTSIIKMLEHEADFAIVIGGYNSSNTSHLVELCEEKLQTFFVNSEACLIDEKEIHHFDLKEKKEKTTFDYLPKKEKLKVMITSGASCPDALVDQTIVKLAQLCKVEYALQAYMESISGVQ